ncbi:formate hydrogenlyase subunit 3/multisubunit Na+/H+ antiporter, MnhD subunit [Gottschalkia purinilytica]|uniref:Formate hydrogenlyase subunit 3/multisubunit Na+/H+ antiporter, MnhD subunit n=1 Tax=Gottschalkia purinilytica TaxID=1503 RepID=A0A0L0WEU9_GOTPU|nr:complex I subunit 5 family protein [Gottschalkia purinilytica]KNF10008.1 formate hydrogenlyase subunit 3/multisubunit Na+/H+ antiporter, MnhD subunit [Gottschalkia purinilytica]
MVYKILLISIILIPIFGTIVGLLLGRKNEKYRNIFNILTCGIELLIVSALYKPVFSGGIEFVYPNIMATGLYLKLDPLRYIFVWMTIFAWFLTLIYSTQYLIKYKNRNRYYSFFMLTLSSTLGVFLSENILNLFTFFELMSFTSYALIIHDEEEYSHGAGRAYIIMAVTGSLILLMGLLLLFDYTGSLNISELGYKLRSLGGIKYLISWLIIFGFGVKSAMFPLHSWLPKAHPAAPTPASAVLSGILIKTGIFGILITVGELMEGDVLFSAIIGVLGLVNMVLGGFLAMFQTNVKKILAYSSMSQSGYLIFAIGLMGILNEEGGVAIQGTLYHAVSHAMFKVLLFLSIGIIYMVLHELDINKIRGFGKHKKTLKIVFLIGLLSSIGFPGFNGFVSKTLIHDALSKAHIMYNSSLFSVIEVLFTLSSSFTVAYMLKIFVTVFLEKNEHFTGQYKKYIKKRAIIPLIILGVFCIYTGLNPKFLINIINPSLDILNVTGVYVYSKIYTFKNINSSITSIFIGILIYTLFIKKYLRKEEDGKLIYKNPTLNWFKIDENIYIPIFLFVYRTSLKIFKYIDKCMVTVFRNIRKEYFREK